MAGFHWGLSCRLDGKANPPPLLDHLVGARDQRRWNRQPERPRGF
jgi:hypothetical protein